MSELAGAIGATVDAVARLLRRALGWAGSLTIR
jgi:hypothetical protein